MKVRELMRADPASVSTSTRVSEVARLMLGSGAAGLPVVDANGRFQGLVTQFDVVSKHANVHAPAYLGILGYTLPFGSREDDEELRRILAVTAGELMEEHVATIGPDDDIEAAATLMVDRRANPIPVVEGGRLVGLLSATDVLKLVLNEEERDERESH